MNVMFVATHWTQTLENFLRTLRKFHYKYTWLGHNQTWTNFSLKTKLIYDQLNNQQTNDDIVVILDSYDVLVNRHANDLESSFLTFKRPIVLGSEWYCGNKKNCKDIQNYWNLQEYVPSKKYANAGFVMGQSKYLKKMYEHMLKYEDDQLGMISYINEYPEDIAIDHNNFIVQHTHILDTTMNEPFFYHFPGPLLKKGLFPQYNNTVRKILGDNGFYIYPTEYYYLIAFITFFAIILFFYKYK